MVDAAASFVVPTLGSAAVAAYRKLWGDDGFSAGTLDSSSLKALCCGIGRLGELKRDTSRHDIEKVAAFWQDEIGVMNKFAHHMREFLGQPETPDFLTKVQEFQNAVYDKRKTLKANCIKQVNPELAARLEREMESEDEEVKGSAWNEFRRISPEFWGMQTKQSKLGLPEGIADDEIARISSEYSKQKGQLKDQTDEVWRRLRGILEDGFGLETILDSIETIGGDLLINQHRDIMMSPTKLAEFLRQGFMKRVLEFAPQIQAESLEDALKQVEKETICEEPPEDLPPLDASILRRLELLDALDRLPPLDNYDHPDTQVLRARFAARHSAGSAIVP